MTGDLLIDTAISLAGIAVLVLAVALAFRAPPPPVSEAEARERLAFDEPDFEPQQWLIDKGGRAALALAENGEAATVRRLGRDLVTRRFKASAAKFVSAGDRLIIKLADHTAPDIALDVGEEAATALVKIERR